jgi:hypothetical protein
LETNENAETARKACLDKGLDPTTYLPSAVEVDTMQPNTPKAAEIPLPDSPSTVALDEAVQTTALLSFLAITDHNHSSTALTEYTGPAHGDFIQRFQGRRHKGLGQDRVKEWVEVLAANAPMESPSSAQSSTLPEPCESSAELSGLFMKPRDRG